MYRLIDNYSDNNITSIKYTCRTRNVSKTIIEYIKIHITIPTVK